MASKSSKVFGFGPGWNYQVGCCVTSRETYRAGRLKNKNGAKILVIDDNSVVRDVVSRMLSLLGHEVSSADSGEKGLSIFLENIFDIVLSDYEMPGMDGVALACRVKISAPCTLVIIRTGAGRDTVFSRKSTAVDQVISKPFTLEEIDETLQGL